MKKIGEQCRGAPITQVAKEWHLTWKTVKALDKEYMKGLLAKRGNPAPEVIGIDEISIKKGHTYRIIVSDLKRKRALWFGGKDRAEASMKLFYEWLGKKKQGKIRLVVMDMWKPLRKVAMEQLPGVTILYDKFHVIKHLQEAMDAVRKAEYQRVEGKDRTYIKGQKYTLLSRKKNLSTKGKQALKLVMKANKRLQVAYLLKETFSQLWDYNSEAWARKFFDNWKASLKWQRLPTYKKFAELVERHWDGIVSYCKPENKVALGYVEGLNNKIRVIQRRSYGLQDEEYLRLKILTSTLQN
jgi:transposase